MSNYPDGMRESDIPGWNDYEVEVPATCPLCDHFDEASFAVVSEGVMYFDCENCDCEWEESVPDDRP